jgi:hypothetical protein
MKKKKKQVNRGRDWENQHPPIYIDKDIVEAIKRDVVFPSEDARTEVHIERKIKFLLDHYNEDLAWREREA